MLKFGQFIVEMAALVSKGKNLNYQFSKYIKPYLPSETPDDKTLHTGKPTHEINNDHYIERGKKLFSKGEKVILHGIKDMNGIRHIDVENAEGKRAFIPANKINKVGGRAGKDQERLEAEQIANIHQHITEHLARTGQSSTTVEFPDGTKAKVAGITRVNEKDKTGRKVKADAYFHDEKGNPVHYMSLKGHRFQQFGGVSEHAEKPTVQDAVKKFKAATSQDRSRRHQYTLDTENIPEHRELVHQAMYGSEHGKAHSVNNVHAIYIGNIGFKPSEDNRGLMLTASRTYSNKNNNATSDIAKAKILRRNARDRSDMGVSSSRIGIYPQDESPNAIEMRGKDD